MSQEHGVHIQKKQWPAINPYKNYVRTYWSGSMCRLSKKTMAIQSVTFSWWNSKEMYGDVIKKSLF